MEKNVFGMMAIWTFLLLGTVLVHAEDMDKGGDNTYKADAAATSPTATPTLPVFSTAESIENYKQILKRNPNNIKAYNELGMIYLKLNLQETAIKEFKKALSVEPYYPVGPFFLGDVSTDRKVYKETISSFERAVNMTEELGRAHNNLGLAYMGLKDFGAGEAEFKKALKINPDHAKAYNNLATLYENWDKKNEAIASYKKALEISPDNEEIKHKLAIVQGLKDSITMNNTYKTDMNKNKNTLMTSSPDNKGHKTKSGDTIEILEKNREKQTVFTVSENRPKLNPFKTQKKQYKKEDTISIIHKQESNGIKNTKGRTNKIDLNFKIENVNHEEEKLDGDDGIPDLVTYVNGDWQVQNQPQT